MEYTKLRILDRIHGEIDIVSSLISLAGKSDAEKDLHIQNWISNKDFTIVSLYSKAPRYSQGAKKYAEYFLDITPNGNYINRAVRKDWIDLTAPRMVSLFTSGANNTTNILTIAGDFSKEIEVGAVHTLLDGTTYAPKGQATVISSVINAGNLDIVYSSITGINVGDIIYFQKGERLIGVDINIAWYNIDDITVGIHKTVERRFSIAEASEYEYARRERSIRHMIAEADGTPISPNIKAIIDHYSAEIKNYIELMQAQEWKDAIDSETDPVINAYLDIVIAVTDIEGNVVTAMIRDMIKNELYMGYQ